MFTEDFHQLPRDIEELNLSSYLAQLKNIRADRKYRIPRKLDLSANTQLNYNAWPHLERLKDLEELRLTFMPQIDREQKELIKRTYSGRTLYV